MKNELIEENNIGKKGYITMKDINKQKNESAAISEDSPTVLYQNVDKSSI